MDKKLTLKLDGTVIERAKEYAESSHQSVSGIVEKYLRTLTGTVPAKAKSSKLVSELSGLISLPEGYDEKADYRASRASRSNG